MPGKPFTLVSSRINLIKRFLVGVLTHGKKYAIAIFAGLQLFFTAEGYCQEPDSLTQSCMAASRLKERNADYPGAIKELLIDGIKPDYFLEKRLAYLYALQKDYAESSRHAERALYLLPASEEMKLYLMNLYFDRGYYAKALRYCRKVLKNNKLQKDANLIAARLSLINLDFVSAKVHLRNILNLWPLDRNALILYRYCESALQNRENASNALFRLTNVYPDDPGVIEIKRESKP